MGRHKQTKATAIPQAVKDAVFQRDGGRCIVCGEHGSPHCHIVRRSQGGKGVEQNIVTLCGKCHYSFDEGLFIERLRPLGIESRQDVEEIILNYIKALYPDWTRESVTYKKWR